ncbi:MAG: PDZ domain-containing protein [Pseudomonadota bacterium]
MMILTERIRQLNPRIIIAAAEVVLVVLVASFAVQIALYLAAPVGPVGEKRTSVNAGFSGQPVQTSQSDIFWISNRRAPSLSRAWVLHGLSVSANPAGSAESGFAIVSPGKAKQQLTARPGELLDDATRLVEIGADYVVLENASGRQRVYLDDAPAGSQDAQRAQPNPAQGFVLPGQLDMRLLRRYGFQSGDRVLSVNDKQIRGEADLAQLAAQTRSPGSTVRVTFVRAGQTLEKVL